MRAYHLSIALLSLSAFAPSAIHAQGAVGTAQPSAAAKKTDLNEIVCEKQKVPGSRLATAKVCKTRAEWADLRHQDRMDLERAQTQRGNSDR
jgi:hypothetical protein